MSDFLNDLMSFDSDKPVDRSQIERAPFYYLGSKLKMIPNLMPLLPYRKRWVDHFGGSGVVTLNRKQSQVEIFNDRWSGITCFFRALREHRHMLIAKLETMLSSREEFMHCRATWCHETDTVERAAKWYYMMQMSVNGKGTAYGRMKDQKHNPLWTGLERFVPVHHRMKYVMIENLDFETCFKDFDTHDCVHYCDPPYSMAETQQYDGKWTRDDLDRLLRAIGNSKGFVALSGHPDPQIESCSFWTNKQTFVIQNNAQPNAFNEENGKEQRDRFTMSEEVVWIKE